RPLRGVGHVPAGRECRKAEGLSAVPSERSHSTTDGAHRGRVVIGSVQADARLFHVWNCSQTAGVARHDGKERAPWRASHVQIMSRGDMAILYNQCTCFLVE
ncbi:MAG: hypothetical protein ACXVDN_18800, partial [Ktedonobacteraceae bacterium]